jgi:hypothetical protein
MTSKENRDKVEGTDKARKVSQGLENEVVSDHCEKMRRKKETNLNGDPTSKAHACTNDSENVTGSQETRVRTVGNGEETQSGRWDGK